MPPNPYAFYWSQFSFRTSASGYADRSAEARASRSEEPHDARTRRMIEQYDEIYKNAHAEVVVPLIDEWSWLERMGDQQQKQAMLEPLIQRWQRAPRTHEGELVFLLLVLEPIRRSVAGKFLAGAPQASKHSGPSGRHRRQEERIIWNMEREDLFDHTRVAALEIVEGYKFTVQPGRFFSWFRETLAWKVIRIYRKEYLGPNSGLPPVQVEALQGLLHGFEAMGEPDLRDVASSWHSDIWHVRSLFSLVDSYREAPQVRKICQSALGRLGHRQRETLQAYFYDGLSLLEIAENRGVSPSTVGNTKAQAESRLRSDDIFYCALDAIGRVRIDARRREIEERYPGGLLPDGRRIQFIGG